ncbi:MULTISPECIES: restriction endonuclease subunit S [Acinetobacter]|uniref:restriction endonuclease subunit S n=1 Tax=Acinetobacter TaxID=469 RepID=UPI0024ACF13D|nr:MULTISPECIES: restriction endonuclease subunit S [Acinetobacter]MDI6622637.1 restriction endonuclease subunit S [Acinetobacter junii]
MSSTLRLFWEAAGGNVPEHWEFKTIDELLEHPKAISVGVMYPGSDTDGGVPLIKVSDVKNGAIASRPSFCISNKVDEEYKRTRLNGSELLLTLVGNPGDCVIVTDEMCGWNVARALAVIRLKDTQLRSWIRYVLASKPAQHLIEARLNTTVQKTLNLKDVREIGIPMPPREERDSITKVIDLIEKNTLLNTQINQTLESIAQVIFKSWFVDFDPVRAKIAAKQEGKDPELAAMCAISGKNEEELQQMSEDDFAELQASAALFPDELVENELGEVPKGWEILDIDKTTSLIIDHRGKTPKKLGSDWSDTGITVLSAKHIKDGYIVNREQLRFVDTELYNKWMKEELEEGDILLTSEGPMGEMYYLASDEKYCLSQRLYALRANTDLISSAFLYFWLLSPYAKSDMNGRATGTTVVGIRQSELRKVKVLTPSKNICDLFNEKVKANLKQIALNNNKSVNLAQIRDTLLSKLLSGEIDVSGLQIEVA